MIRFIYDGKIFTSLASFARSYNVSYQKLRRYCRHYKRARENPAVACDWLLNRQILNHRKELKTIQYQQDLDNGRERQARFIDKIQNKTLQDFLKSDFG